MNTTNTIVAMMTAAFAAAAAFADDSSPFLLDTMPGTRIATDGVAEPIAYSPRWGGAASCSITADGARVLSNATDDGTHSWTPRGTGRHALSFEAGATRYEAAFTVLGDDVALHGGVLAAGENWAADKTHLVTAAVTVPSGITLTIASGAVVKFMDGTSLKVASGGACVARGVIFTHVADDTAGGDTMMDGDGGDGSPGTARPTMGAYAITGTITDDDATEYRYMPPQLLTSSIASNTRLRGHRCYIVSNSVTVASGATLTLQPGTVLKFNTGCSLTVNGTLDAYGTRAAPIVFTSLKDDAHGGDTNGDQNSTTPQPGDWHQITGSGTVVMNYCQVLWCSAQNNQGALYPNGGTWTFDNSIVAHCEYDCMRSYGGTFTARNSVFTDSSMGAAPSSGTARFDNCVFYDLTTAVRWGNGTFNNCIFAEITQDIIDTKFYSSTLSSKFSHCCFWNPESTGDHASAKVGSDGNFYADPLFLDPDNGDFRIFENSPCVDAGDSTVAPKLDFYGQPRTTVRPAPTGTPDALGRHADIGLHEYYLSNEPGPYDLAADSVSASTAAAEPGGTLSVSWAVRNAGKRTVPDPWHDALALVSVATGKAYTLGEPLNPGALAVGASRESSVEFSMPVVPSGDYRLRLSVNSRRADVAEGSSTANNAVLSDSVVAVALAATPASSGATESVAPGASSVTAFSIPADSGDLLLRVSSPAGGAALSGRCGLGFLPVDGTSGSALVFADGEAWLSVPAGTETVYLVLENAGASPAAFSADFQAGSLAVSGVSPATLPTSGTVTLDIAGAGFADGCTVTLGGSSAAVKAVRCVSASLLAVTVDCAKLAAGSRPALVIRKGAESKTLANAVSVSAAPGAPKFWAKLSVPESVREGRLVSTCFVEYGNSGTADMAAPVLQVAMDGNGTLGYVDGLSGLKTLQFVAAGDEGSAGVLRPGASHRIRFALRAGSRNAISLHTSEGSTYAPAPWTSAATYLADLSAATTRIGLRGQDPTDYEEVLSLARAVNAGETTAVICGRFAEADGTAIGDVLLKFENKATGNALYAATDSDGRFQSSVAPDGTYAVSCAGIPLAGGFDAATIAGGKDVILSLSAAECAIARVAVKGGTDGLVALATDIDTDASYPGVAGTDGFEFRGLSNGSYRVELFRDENLVFFGRILVNGGEILSESLEYDGSAPGTLELSTDAATAATGAGFFVFSSDSEYLRLVFADETTASATLTIPAGIYNIVLAGTDGETAPSTESVVVSGLVTPVHLAATRSSSALSAGRALRTTPVGIARRGLTGEANDVVSRSQRAYNKALQLKNVPLNPPKGDRDCIHNRDLYNYYSSYRDKFCATFADFVKIYYQYVDATKAYIYQNNSTWMGVIKDCYGILAAGAFKGASAVTTGLDMIFESAANGDISRDTFFSLLEESGIPVISQGGKVAAQGEKVWRILQEFSATHMFELQYNLHKRTMEDTNLPRFEEWIAQFEQFLIDNDNYAYRECCPMVFPETPYAPPVQTTRPSVPQSCDPNEMGGPLGFDASRALLPGETYEWTIYFENQTNATAAASEVRVDVQLSAQLDWSTFETVAVSFGNQTDMGLEGKANGTSECAVPGTNYTVHSEVALDASGVVSWYLRIVDPDGDEEGYPLDSTGGFLPPNDETHRGEGSITYRVAVRKNATQGARIDASADIRFDNNPIIVTDPAWWNTVATVYKPTVDLGDGTTANLVLVVGQPYGALPTPKARAGCTFAGWFTGPNGTGRKVTAESIVRVGDRGLYAYWMPTAFTVKFDANGGKGKMAAQKVAPGKSAKLSANKFTKSGCVFLGWAKSKKGPVAYANAASVKNLAAAGKTVTLYAKWAKKNYKVAFYANGGKGKMAAQKMTYGKAKKLSKNKFKAPKGKKFAGWAKSKADAKKGNVAYKNKKAVKNLVLTGRTVKLYAVWKKK